jgi:hypothetical protein
MIKEIENYITKQYYFLLSVAKKYTKNDDWASELLHEVVLQLYDRKTINVKLDDESIKSYIIRALMINWCYPTSPFYIKYKKHNLTHTDITQVIEMAQIDTEIDNHKFMDILEEEFGNLYWFNKLLMEKYFVLGSLKKVSVDTKIPLPSIGRYIKETKFQVKEKTLIRFNKE